METPKKRFFLFRFIDFISVIGSYIGAFLLGVIAVGITFEIFLRKIPKEVADLTQPVIPTFDAEKAYSTLQLILAKLSYFAGYIFYYIKVALYEVLAFFLDFVPNSVTVFLQDNSTLVSSTVAEYQVYFWIAVGMLGAACTLKDDGHFCITILIDKFSSTGRRAMQVITHSIGIVYSVAIVVYGFLMAQFSYEFEDISTGLLATPLWIPQSLLCIGGALLALQFFNKIVNEITNYQP